MNYEVAKIAVPSRSPVGARGRDARSFRPTKLISVWAMLIVTLVAAGSKPARAGMMAGNVRIVEFCLTNYYATPVRTEIQHDSFDPLEGPPEAKVGGQNDVSSITLQPKQNRCRELTYRYVNDTLTPHSSIITVRYFFNYGSGVWGATSINLNNAFRAGDKQSTPFVLTPLRGRFGVSRLSAEQLRAMQVRELTGSGTYAILFDRSSRSSQADWMGALAQRNPDLKLNQITVPGSHDAGMSTVTNCFGSNIIPGGVIPANLVQTQSRSMSQQLDDGVRYFDLRVRATDRPVEEWRTYHGETQEISGASVLLGCEGEKLVDILKGVSSFLDSHKGETIILKFSHTNTTVPNGEERIVATVGRYLGAHRYLGNEGASIVTVPGGRTLKQTAGKVLTAFDSEFRAQRVRQDKHGKYVDLGNFQYCEMLESGGGASCNGLWVYDRYANTPDFETMRTDQLCKLRKFGNGGLPNRSGYFHFLLSWTLTSELRILSGRNTLDVRQLANSANARLPDLVDQIANGEVRQRPSVIFYDFENAAYNSAIIGLNDTPLSTAAKELSLNCPK